MNPLLQPNPCHFPRTNRLAERKREVINEGFNVKMLSDIAETG